MQIQNDTFALNQYKAVRQAIVSLGDQGSESVHKETYQSSDAPTPLGSGSTTVQLHPHDRYTVTKDLNQIEGAGDFAIKAGSSVDFQLSNVVMQNGLDGYGRTIREYTETPGGLDFDQRTYTFGDHINLYEHELIDSSNGAIISHSTGRA